jgi:hypothetical protein
MILILLLLFLLAVLQFEKSYCSVFVVLDGSMDFSPPPAHPWAEHQPPTFFSFQAPPSGVVAMPTGGSSVYTTSTSLDDLQLMKEQQRHAKLFAVPAKAKANGYTSSPVAFAKRRRELENGRKQGQPKQQQQQQQQQEEPEQQHLPEPPVGQYNTSVSLDDEALKEQIRHEKLLASPAKLAHANSAAALLKIRREIESQKDVLHHMMHPGLGFEERMLAVQAKAKEEQHERAVRVKARYERTNKLKQEKEAQRQQEAEEHRLQIRRRAGSLVGLHNPRRLPPLRGSASPVSDGDGGNASSTSPVVLSLLPAKSPSRLQDVSPARSILSLRSGQNTIEQKSVERALFLTVPPSPSSPSPVKAQRPITEAEMDEQLNALRDLRVAQEAVDTLEKAMLRTQCLVQEANRRTVRAILHSGHDLKGFMLEPALLITRFAMAAFSARVSRCLAEDLQSSLVAELERRAEAAEHARLAALLASLPPSEQPQDGSSACATRDMRSPGSPGANSTRHAAAQPKYAPSVNVAAFVLDVIDSTGLVMTREYVQDDLVSGRLF